jgi:hypothetical protein
MVDRALIDALKFQGDSLASRWRDQIRKSPQLKVYNDMSDEDLIKLNHPFYPQLARSLERGLDKNALGAFFVRQGKDFIKLGIPLSETVLAMNICRQVIIERLESESVLDNPLKLYQAIGTSSEIAEFFFLGCFYLTKGSLEAIYESMQSAGEATELVLKKYFNDDFYFKK